MRLSTILFAAFRFLLLPATIATVLLYLYPAVQNCSFPTPPPAKTETSPISSHGQQDHAHPPSRIAPLRLLALGDPQLEGDTSLPDPDAPAFPSFVGLSARLAAQHPGVAFTTIKKTFESVGANDIPQLVSKYRKILDLWGNDLYLAHIHRLVSWWTQPTHTVVLGDLLGSQWITDDEFERRSVRLWGHVFKGMDRVDDDIMEYKSGLGDQHSDDEEADAVPLLPRGEIITSEEYKAWETRLIAVAGNHDIGYAGDINTQRAERFERKFGRLNWRLRFELPINESMRDVHDTAATSLAPPPPPPTIDLIILNDMNLDGPAWDRKLQQESRDFLDQAIAVEQAHGRQEDATILLTHIPLFKRAGLCVDSPFFDYFPDDQGGGIREQNQLSPETSERILNGLFGAEHKAGLILNGHDHEGCDVYHDTHLQTSQIEDGGGGDGGGGGGWNHSQYPHSREARGDEQRQGVREITVRSMMGSYGGNAGLLSAWFDDHEGVWKFEYEECRLGIQHIWWAVHVLDLIVILLPLASLGAFALETTNEQQKRRTLARTPVSISSKQK